MAVTSNGRHIRAQNSKKESYFQKGVKKKVFYRQDALIRKKAVSEWAARKRGPPAREGRPQERAACKREPPTRSRESFYVARNKNM